jgi:predicted phage-related endonuclease/AraC-like DNA-binding protein
MRILRLSQGSPEWHQHRATRCNASDAPAMLGESPHMTRDELLQRMATGLAPEVDAGTQRRFDDGHAVEVLLRAQAEKMLGEPLYAFVGVPDDEESLLSASFDGSTFVGDTTVECKLLNARLRAAFADMETIAPAHREKTAAKSLPIDYRIQLEQQVRVAASDRALFLAGELRDDGTLGDTFSCWYYPDDELWQRIVKGWYQFLDDRATYAPREAAPKAVAAPVESLPAVSIRMEGALTVRSNLQTLGPILRAFIEKIPVQPTTDQEFADTDAACKALKKIEDALDAEENSALSELAEVEEMRRLKADLHALARTTRLQREKLVKARKDQIRIEECQRGRTSLDAHIASLNRQIGAPYMPPIVADFGAAISGLKSFDSLRAKVDQLLADKKIEANDVSGRITLNLRTLKAHGDYDFLFADLKTIVTKQPEDFQALVQSRVLAHQQEKQRRAAAVAEKERERIRQEEADKLRREQEAAQQAPAPTAPALIAVPAHSSKPQAANSSSVVPITHGAPTLRIGEIANRLGFGVTEAFLRQLGFAPSSKQGASCLFHEDQFDLICEALVAHVRTVQAKLHEAVAA